MSEPVATEKTWEQNQRDRISQILVKNNLRTDQVAICELHNLVKEALNEGEALAYAKRNI